MWLRVAIQKDFVSTANEHGAAALPKKREWERNKILHLFLIPEFRQKLKICPATPWFKKIIKKVKYLLCAFCIELLERSFKSKESGLN